MAPAHPTLINLPQPSSTPDTPSDMPGTPTSTTTSLSALSTTAIKDGHRGHALPHSGHRGGHHQHSSQNSLEAERADRISRLAGLSSVSQLRTPPNAGSLIAANSPQTTPTSSGFPHNATQSIPPHVLGVPAYFDSNGQPVAVTKVSTVGTASATESDIDMMSSATNFGPETEVDSTSGYVGTTHTEHTDMDVDEDAMTNRSVGQFEQEENMSDDGSASLVGFGEGANSTISGPIYVRRPLPGNMERTTSGLSDGAVMTPAAERHDARILDGVSSGGTHGGPFGPDDDGFVDTTNSGPVPVSGNFQPGHNSSLRETQHGPHTRHHWKHQQPPTAREAAERAMKERNMEHWSRPGGPAVASPSKKLAFEEK